MSNDLLMIIENKQNGCSKVLYAVVSRLIVMRSSSNVTLRTSHYEAQFADASCSSNQILEYINFRSAFSTSSIARRAFIAA